MRYFTRGVADLLRILAVGAALLVVPACERYADPARRTISPERFIEVYVALRQIDDAEPTAAEQRRAVLEEHGVTEEEMRRFVEARADRPRELAEIWERIERRMQEEVEPDTVPEMEPAGDTLPGALSGLRPLPLGEVAPLQLAPQGREEALPGEAHQA